MELKKIKTERSIQGEYIQVIWDPLQWLSITMGLRQDRYSDFGRTLNPKGGIVIIPFEKISAGTLILKILGGSAFRAPTFQELYDRTQQYQIGGIFGNDKLKPETIRTIEIGADYNTPYKPLSILLNGYANKIYNNIDGFNQSNVFPGRTDTYVNLRGISMIGYEVEARLNYSAKNYGYANASWVQVLDSGGIPPNDKVDTVTFRIDVPQARANIGINHEFTKYFTLNNSVWISSERGSNSRYPSEAQDNRAFRIPQYHIWNVSLATTDVVSKNLNFALNIFNLNNYKLYDDINNVTSAFYPNRVIPSGYLWGRYIEFKLTYFLN
ncbi:MAG TPA: TonB-dependent receptor [Leptospiraceae bacterium]|nr:TonB-dependent receptor [Leptospiraceae bacterium]HNF56192.1 TonB-dependent receptor [Leptospiraceae bacterium]HNL71429.1 TonB-dependent receptor [Leptospiraceae bacterium]